MPGLVPGTHVFLRHREKADVDGRDKRGHDGVGSLVAGTAVPHLQIEEVQIGGAHDGADRGHRFGGVDVDGARGGPDRRTRGR